MNNKESLKLSGLIKLLVLIFSLNLFFGRYLQLQQVYAATPNFDLMSTLLMSLKLPHFWTGLLVPITYLLGLWAAAKLLSQLEMNTAFTSEMWEGLRRLAEYLVYGAFAAIVIVPTLEAWISLDQRSFKMDWDVATVTIGMIGVVLKLVARRAAALAAPTE